MTTQLGCTALPTCLHQSDDLGILITMLLALLHAADGVMVRNVASQLWPGILVNAGRQQGGLGVFRQQAVQWPQHASDHALGTGLPANVDGD